MRYNENKANPPEQNKQVPKKPKPLKTTEEPIKESEKPETKESDLSADQLAILFICHRGHQSLISILQGVNSTRVPVGKSPIKEAELQGLLKVLENQGYLSRTEIHDQTTWISTTKAKDLET